MFCGGLLCSCDIHCADNKGTTPLHWAAAANQPGLVQLLLRWEGKGLKHKIHTQNNDLIVITM